MDPHLLGAVQADRPQGERAVGVADDDDLARPARRASRSAAESSSSRSVASTATRFGGLDVGGAGEVVQQGVTGAAYGGVEDVTVTRCPCSSGLASDECCGPVLADPAAARTAEQLMRSRYTAYVRGDVEHLLRDLAPAHPPGLAGPGRRRALGGPGGAGPRARRAVRRRGHGRVPGPLAHRFADGRTVQHEVSRFVREDGRWLYVDGSVD